MGKLYHDQRRPRFDSWAFLLTFAGVGLRIDFREMKKQGIRPFIVGALGEIAIAGITLRLVIVASRIVPV